MHHLYHLQTLQTRITIIWTPIAIGVALYLGITQLNISKKQNKLSKDQQELWERQFEIDIVRYAIDTRIINKNEARTIIIDTKEELKRTDLTKEKKARLEDNIKKIDKKIPKLNKEIENLIVKYHRVLNRHPNKFKLED